MPVMQHRSRSVKYVGYVTIQSEVLLTQIYLPATYSTTFCACKQNDPLQRPCCTTEGFWYVRLCLQSWTLDRLMKTFLNSGSPELLAHNTWDLYVRVLFCCFDLPLSCASIQPSSWEYVTTLDFELDIIRGRRSYRWTIWVSSDRRFFTCCYLSIEIPADFPVTRYTRLRAQPFLSP